MLPRSVSRRLHAYTEHNTDGCSRCTYCYGIFRFHHDDAIWSNASAERVHLSSLTASSTMTITPSTQSCCHHDNAAILGSSRQKSDRSQLIKSKRQADAVQAL